MKNVKSAGAKTEISGPLLILVNGPRGAPPPPITKTPRNWSKLTAQRTVGPYKDELVKP